jgi:hypothetical protein
MGSGQAQHIAPADLAMVNTSQIHRHARARERDLAALLMRLQATDAPAQPARQNLNLLTYSERAVD